MTNFPRIPTGEVIGFDSETNGLKYWLPNHEIIGFSVAHNENSWYFDVKSSPGCVDWLKDVLYGANTVAAHFAQFDYQSARCLGLNPRRINFYCSMTADCIIQEHSLKYDLSSVAQRNGVDSKKDSLIEKIRLYMGWKDKKEVLARLAEAPLELVSDYGASDAIDVLRIYRAQKVKIDYQELDRVLELEMQVLPVLADMSFVGVRVNLEAAKAAIPVLIAQQEILQKEIEEITGGSFNVNSSPQVKAFFKPEKINKWQWKLSDDTIVGPTKGGNSPCIGQDELRTMTHPLAVKILALRKCIKLRSTFLEGHILGNADANSYIHTSFNQLRTDQDAGTVTGRLSSSDPALQQITNRDKEKASILRSMFLPDEGQSWMRADYSQVDFRMSAHLINDPQIIAAYAADPNTDYHQIVSNMTGIPRNPAYAGAPNTKTLNLCVSGDTEYLSPTGWKRIDSYDGGLVAQWRENGVAEFVIPSKYCVGKSEDLYELKSKHGNLRCTGNHRLPILVPWKEYSVVERTVEYLSKPRAAGNHSLETFWTLNGDGVSGWTDDEIRLAVAFQADGLTGFGTKGVEGEHRNHGFVFKKERKILRMRELLSRLKVKFSESILGSGCTRFGILKDSPQSGQHGKSFIPKWAVKRFPWVIFDLSKEQKAIILEELMHWDGCISTNTYGTSILENAEYVQLLCASCGIDSSIGVTEFENKNWNTAYRVRIQTSCKRRSILSSGISRINGEHDVFCFTVPSSWFVARRDGFIHVTGNSLAFGAGAGRAAKSMGMPFELGEYKGRMCYLAGPEAKALFEKYHRMNPGVKKFAKHAEAIAKSTGYVRTILGRRLRFPPGVATHKVTGILFQSYAADVNKMGLVCVDNLIRKDKLPARLLLSVHDEIAVSMPNDMTMALLITKAFTSPGEMLNLRVPILASTGIGNNWWDASLKEIK